MNNEKLIREIAEPILQKLLEMDEKTAFNQNGQIPIIHLCYEETNTNEIPFLDDALLKEIETYVQTKFEESRKPTVLH